MTGYVARRFGATDIAVTHREHGVIPLGFAPAASATAGPRHILLGTKRGLVKPSAGYGILRIEQESQRLAGAWRCGKPLPASQRYHQPWQLLDRTFLQLINGDPASAQSLMRQSMQLLGLGDALRFLDGHASVLQLAHLMKSTFPIVSPYMSKHVTRSIIRHMSGGD